MSYTGTPRPLGGEELTSIKRLREAGVKGMKWGSRKDAKSDRHVSAAINHASKVGDTKMVQKLKEIQGDARSKGSYSGKTSLLNKLSSQAYDNHNKAATRMDIGREHSPKLTQQANEHYAVHSHLYDAASSNQ